MGMSLSMGTKKKFKLITEYPVKEYACRLVAGDKLRLRKDLIIASHDGKPSGQIERAGGIWEVLPGSVEPPDVVWLRQPDGKRHTWDDSNEIYEYFELLER